MASRRRGSTQPPRAPGSTPRRCARRATGAISGVAGQDERGDLRRRAAAVAARCAGGCASTLAFEIQRRAEPAGRQLRRRRRARGADPAGARPRAAHHRGAFDAGVGDSNSTAIHADGTLGTRRRRGRAGRARRPPAAGSRRAMTAMPAASACSTPPARCRGDGRELRGEDMLSPAGRRRKAERDPVRDPLPSRRRGSRSRRPPTGTARCCGSPGASGSSAAAAAAGDRGKPVDRRRGAPARDAATRRHRRVAGGRHDDSLGAQAGVLSIDAQCQGMT